MIITKPSLSCKQSVPYSVKSPDNLFSESRVGRLLFGGFDNAIKVGKCTVTSEIGFRLNTSENLQLAIFGVTISYARMFLASS